MRDRARTLRRERTPAEGKVWEALRREQCGGWRFRRQEVLGQYIADFYCPAARLILEIDGAVHERAKQRERDTNRTAALIETRNLRVLRLGNADVLAWSCDQIRRAILEAIGSDRPKPP